MAKTKVHCLIVQVLFVKLRNDTRSENRENIKSGVFCVRIQEKLLQKIRSSLVAIIQIFSGKIDYFA